jgi:nicotinate-nucleotide pyrophosphorylase (carboxylating)
MDAVKQALKEDIGKGDITTESIVTENHASSAIILAKEDGIICGIDIAKEVFKAYDDKVSYEPLAKDGEKVRKGQVVARVSGKTRSLLSCERVALNFLQRMSGIATLTNRFVMAVEPYKAKIMETRKTTPCLRKYEKYAVKCGGGLNHRFGLYDMVLIKPAHIKVAGSIKKAVGYGQKGGLKIEVEVRNIQELKEALQEKVDFIMLDNFSVGDIKKAVALTDGKMPLEASGGINLENVRQIAATGVDRISIGALTHSCKSLDMSMEIVN